MRYNNKISATLFVQILSICFLVLCAIIPSEAEVIEPKFKFSDLGALRGRVLIGKQEISFSALEKGRWDLYICNDPHSDTSKILGSVDSQNEDDCSWELISQWDETNRISYIPSCHSNTKIIPLTERHFATKYKLVYADETANFSESMIFYWVLRPIRPTMEVLDWDYHMEEDETGLYFVNSDMQIGIDCENASEFTLRVFYIGNPLFHYTGGPIPTPENFVAQAFEGYAADPNPSVIHYEAWEDCLMISAHNEFGTSINNEVINCLDYIREPEIRSKLYIQALGYDISTGMPNIMADKLNPSFVREGNNIIIEGIPSATSHRIRYSITDAVMGTVCEHSNLDSDNSVNVSELPNGFYILHLEDGKHMNASYKFVK